MTDTTIRTGPARLARALTAAHAHIDTDDWAGLDRLRIDVIDGRVRIVGTDRYTLAATDPGGHADGPDGTFILYADDAARLVADAEHLAALAPDGAVDLEIDPDINDLTLRCATGRRRYALDPHEEAIRAFDWSGILRDRAAEARTDGAAPLLNPRLVARFAAARREVGDMVHTIAFGALPSHPDIARGAIVTVDTWLAGAVMGCNPANDDAEPRPAADTLAAITATKTTA